MPAIGIDPASSTPFRTLKEIPYRVDTHNNQHPQLQMAQLGKERDGLGSRSDALAGRFSANLSRHLRRVRNMDEQLARMFANRFPKSGAPR